MPIFFMYLNHKHVFPLRTLLTNIDPSLNSAIEIDKQSPQDHSNSWIVPQYFAEGQFCILNSSSCSVNDITEASRHEYVHVYHSECVLSSYP